MDKISGLHDDLLVKILSYVPTKIAVSTCILSKRWEFLWMWLPKLDFISNNGHYEGPMPGLRDFIDKNLPLHRAPVIESLRLHLWDTSHFEPKYIKRWIEIAVSRYIRELEICCHQKKENIFPSSLFTCKSLMTLKLKDMVWLPIHVPSMASLPSLKTLLLENVSFLNGKSLQELLCVCPVLEDLKVFSYVPSLQTLSVVIHYSTGYVINTPSLNYLKLEERSYVRHDRLIKYMPKLREVYVNIRDSNLQSVIRSITSAKRLTICCFSEALYGDGVVFNQLEHLKLCVKKRDSLNLLGQLLQNSPNLRVLDISMEKVHWLDKSNGMVSWNQPSSVPECLLSSLQIFKWSRYFGRPLDRDMAVYILKNARHLKTATFLADTTEHFIPMVHLLVSWLFPHFFSVSTRHVFINTLFHLLTLSVLDRTKLSSHQVDLGDKIQVSVDNNSILNFQDMDEISGLPDDVLIKIISYVSTKEAVSTSILSKRWEFLWMWLPKLEFINADNEPVPALCVFINKKLKLHRAPIIESLHLRLGFGSRIIPKDVKPWVEIAVSRHVRDLKISYYSRNDNVFPRNIFACKSLVILKLKYASLMDAPSMVCLASLKTLQLKHVTFGNEKYLQQLLSICPRLEDLLVYCHNVDDNIKVFVLPLFIPNAWPLDGYVIDTPSLKYFKLEDWNYAEHYSIIKNMPKLRKAFIHISDANLQNVMGSITSVKILKICCYSEDVYSGGSVFNQLEHLKLCVCKKDSLKLLAPLLNDSPNLRVLELFLEEDHWVGWRIDMVSLNQLSSVPECLLSSLHIFNWSHYLGSPQERDIAVYILKNARQLKTATILTDTRRNCVPQLQNIKDLTLSSRASSTCKLVFVEDLHHIET